MVEIRVKSDPFKPGWYISEEIQPSTPGAARGRNFSRTPVFRPPTDVFETDEAIVVRVEIAGMDEKEFSVSLVERVLTIRGVRSDIPERRAYHQVEILFGDFFSEVELPCSVVAENAKGEYRAGFLRLELPKVQSQRIHIRQE